MKKYGGFALAALLLATALILASCGGSAGSGGSGEGMKGMDHKEMKHKGHKHTENGSKSGSMKGMDHDNMGSGMSGHGGEYSDRTFIDDMVVHHQGAVAMARVALKNAQHDKIITLSRNIIPNQRAEIEELKSIKKREFGTSRIPMQMSQKQMKGMGMMMDPARLTDQKPFDKAFIDAMIPHHQSAIEMAQSASEKSGNPDIQALANDIISAQRREIEQMQSWREEWHPQG